MDIKESGIDYFKDYEEMRQALNGHFKALSIEKHPNVMVNLLMKRAFDKTFKNYNKDKVSKAMEDRYRDEILNEFRRYYGEWVNIYDFNLKKRGFRTNFEAIFKTEFGRLYGNAPGSVHDHVFYTAHCFEQYKERGDCYNTFPLLLLAYKRNRNTTPTPADMLRFMVLNACHYCWVKNFIYVEVRNGIVVFERLSGGITIAKTFLLPDMDFPKTGWFNSIGCGLHLDPTDFATKLCAKFEKIPIEGKITFSRNDLDYGEYVKTMQEQLRSSGLNI